MISPSQADCLLAALGQPPGAGVLTVAHHGSGGSSRAEFLAAVDPLCVVVSVSADNRFGYPAEAGMVEFTADGRQMWVRTK